MSKIFPKINVKFHFNVKTHNETNEYVQLLHYKFTTHFIISNKDYNFYRNSHLVYQTYPKESNDSLLRNY